MPLVPGETLSHYEIVAPVASGGMGDVYRARDVRLGREVAIKVLSEKLVIDERAVANFAREARAVAALSHPNILAIHDYGQDGSIAYSVTELLEGETLRARVTRGAIPWRKAVEIGSSIADGLAAAHSRGIIHRDLKPENIFLTTDGQVKILDFGIAQLRDDEAAAEADPSTTPTAKLELAATGVIGTAGYMSPEQLRAEELTGSSDIFSLGALLYEMVTGRAAFLRSTVVESLSAILSDHPQPWADSDGAIPQDLSRVIERCLEKNPRERFQSASDLAFALRAIGTVPLTDYVPRARRSARNYRKLAIALVLLALAAAAGWFYRIERRGAPSDAVRSLAILPFVNATADSSAEYLSDGVTESLINSLSHVPGLKVMSRTSVFHYKGSEPDPRRVGRELSVDAVLVGRINRVGKRMVVSVELVDARDSSHLWGERYDAGKSDLFSVQDSIAAEISQRLRLELSGKTQERVARRHTENLEAYDLYLRGRYEWNQRSAESLYRAIGFFERAVAMDPQYALAYAGLADCYNLLDIWAGLPTRDTFPKAITAARKALEIDEELAEAHTSLAYALHNYERNWIDAERQYRRAIALNPNYATAHQWFAEYLTALGRFDEAEQEIRRALELDPLSPIIHAVHAWNLTMARRNDAAIAEGRKTTELFPGFMPGHAYLGLAQLESGRPADAVKSLERAAAILDIVVVRTWAIRAALRAGDRPRGLAAVKTLEESGKTQYLPPYYMAALYAEAGDKVKACKELQRAMEENTGALVWLRVDPGLDPIREEPCYASVLKTAGFR